MVIFSSRDFVLRPSLLPRREPDLLEVVAVLNFDEIDEWEELAGNYGLARFQTLKTDIAEFVSQAYDAEQRVQKLLRSHRRLALARAPLRETLGVDEKNC